MKEKSAIAKRVLSFKYAFRGLFHLFRTETNAKIHLLASILVVGLGLYFKISKGEWSAVVICIALVIGAELINTAIENICDFISPEYHEKIKLIKDLGAAAVLLSAIASVLVGGMVFIPKIMASLP